jgi:hypothetical protein
MSPSPAKAVVVAEEAAGMVVEVAEEAAVLVAVAVAVDTVVGTVVDMVEVAATGIKQ